MKKYINNVIYLTISLFLVSWSVSNEPLSIGFWNGENLFDILVFPIDGPKGLIFFILILNIVKVN